MFTGTLKFNVDLNLVMSILSVVLSWLACARTRK